MKNTIFTILVISFAISSNILTKDAENKPVNWGDMTTMSLEFQSMNKNGYFTSSFSFTYDKDSKDMKTQSVDMVLDFASNDIILGNKATATEADKFSWGLDCSSDSDLCDQVSGETQTAQYMGQYDYTFRKYTTVASLFSGVDLSDEKVGLTVKMCENPKSYRIPFDSNGVFGLGPKSELFKYLQSSTYKFNKESDKSSMFFDYGLFVFTKDNTENSDIKTGTKKGLYDFSDLYLKDWNHDKVNSTIGVTWIEADNSDEQTNWISTQNGALVGFTDDRAKATTLVSTPKRLCFNPNFNGLIGMIQTEYADFDKNVGSLDLSKNPTISLRFDTSSDFEKTADKNLQIEYKTDEYLVSSGGQNIYTVVSVPSTSPADFYKATGCNTYKNGETDVYPWVVGRQFFQKTYTLFRAQLRDKDGKPIDGKRYIGFSQYLPLDKITTKERLILLGFGIIMVGLIIVALVARVNRKDEEGTGEVGQDEYAKV